MTSEEHLAVDLSTPLSMGSSFRFPLQSCESRREMFWGATVLVLLPGVGWLLNMGHRIVMVHRMQQGQSPWPAWRDYRSLLRHGLMTLGGMVYYYAPGFALAYLSRTFGSSVLAWIAGILLLIATIAIPGFMSHYCRKFDPAEIYDPFRALRRCIQGGRAYWQAWSITLAALAISFSGLLALGVGFLVTSIWFWQVAGFSFASVFTQRFGLDSVVRGGPPHGAGGPDAGIDKCEE
ncbi:MAG: hypothetical protein DMG08_00955 [Acidobacteria bacterium]|nr:MAG: hypothetical protein DMG08_00955 [Acidobacteriota bacterium]